ncbi:MAG: glycogen/starch/alpha-glucan phosphorylase [Spirochaetales bacterium]|nr:glycogen/starch/alpha-glucan phosphorylase [Spirochaetales bacterium]
MSEVRVLKFNTALFKERVSYWLDRSTGGDVNDADERQVYEAVSRGIMDLIWDRWRDCEKDIADRKLKKAYYLSAEFLMGRALGNNLVNLGFGEGAVEALKDMGIDLNSAEDAEPDAALGNGGLGRLAACFLESLASLDLPARGYGIRYRYGMFRQKIVDGCQIEEPDDWNANQDPWSVRRGNRRVTVRFGGHVTANSDGKGGYQYRTENTEDVIAIPYDMPIVGWDTDTVGTLRLWEAVSAKGFDLQLFNDMDYVRAVENENRANDLSRVLYPNDSGPTGKILRIRQQYFFSSASLQDILREYKAHHGTSLSGLPKAAAIQLNDTHPVIAIPELMRLLMDEEGLGWEEAWEIVSQTFAYTNHTVLAEALEKWPVDLFRTEFPRIFQIIEEINRRFMAQLMANFPGNQEKHHRMSILADGMVKMAHLAIVASFSVNGVAALHTEILKNDVLADWNALWPQKFNNKTNGVTQRRWLRKANPGLSSLLDECLGAEWTRDLSKLQELKSHAQDSSFLNRLETIKLENKQRLADYVKKTQGIVLNPNTLFDVQIKRLHEYKRQLLNVLSVIHDWQCLHNGEAVSMPPRTVIFGAKAASGYRRAKQIIHLIHRVADLVNADPAAKDKLQVIFVPDYRVSAAEILFPAAEISQQISTAGKEASGTGNMKFMMNGAVTLGTMDGANIEIVREAGAENAFIFGMSSEEVDALRKSGLYDPRTLLDTNAPLRRALSTLVDGTFSTSGDFRELYDSLVYGTEGNSPDPYFVLQDFDSYQQARNAAGQAWENRPEWNRMALSNIAGSGHFSSDRTIAEYAQEIWDINSRH